MSARLDTCVDPGVYDQVLHHGRLDLIPSSQGQLKQEVQVILDEGYYLPMKETRMTDHAGGADRAVGFLFGNPLRNAPDISALRKSHENVDQRDAGTFERKCWEVQQGLTIYYSITSRLVIRHSIFAKDVLETVVP